MACLSGKNAWVMLLAAIILAAVLIKELNKEDSQMLAAFFTVLGDTMALLSFLPSITDSKCPPSDSA